MTVLAWGVGDRSFTPEQVDAAVAVLEERLGEVEWAFLGGSLAVGLGHGTSDVDLYAVGPGLPGGDVIFERAGLQIHVNPVPAAKIRALLELGRAYRATGADRSQLAIEITTLNALIRLTTGHTVRIDQEWRRELDTFDPNVVRQLLMTRNANIFSAYAEDVYGALAAGDLLTAASASAIALEAACEAALAGAGDVYLGPKFLFRRLARNPALAPWCDRLWRLIHREIHPSAGHGPQEIRAVAEDRLSAGGVLLSWCAVEGWDKPLDALPVPAAPGEHGLRRDPYFTPLRFADGWALIGPADGYEVTEETVRLWRDPVPGDPRLADLARYGAVTGYQGAGQETGDVVIRPAPRFGCHPKAAS
ncbi:hypothetical protein J5X84_27810 [Streptosporangiaceae bacterium NEAU-GS5]|nr:hypothetical protein [Streptosporangiaceae bacterium NEAU-GS5]